MSREVRLLPKDSSAYLSSAEIVARLESAFEHVEVDAGRGRASVDSSIKSVERWNPSVYEGAGAPKGSGQEHHRKHLEQLRASRAGAVYVSFGDSADRVLGQTLALPEEGLLFVVEEQWHALLVERCAVALGYICHDI